ncbi:hypothetical protein FDT66_10720 [Polaribacter aestuariivivens]|uniref:Tetratricopeptide repeat protein n=1 Tax=Polaribacter aestuariivivens TaxID=2304626 RepID=A0A5S3N2M7_9FLAO|nr:hypothetical protein [Polaribacter aestuariivivens]TMM29581.1 hypothetical protein FDT66_10720 [Polaribacter aestuariivivens]
MNTNTFIEILEKKQHIQQLETVELKSIVEKYPYFQAARALYLKGLKNQDSFKYNNELKITAAHTTDRTVLFDFITSNDFNHKKEGIHQQISNKISEEKSLTEPKKETPSPSKKVEKLNEKITLIKSELKVGQPIVFNVSESHSFNEWLQLSAKKPIVREKIKPIKTTFKKEELINKFIESNPKIEPLPKDKNLVVPVKKNEQNEALMTETLAKVYLEQKKYNNAMQAYRILSLKYPEKSGFFADQIKRIQILQKNKS